MVVVDVLSSSFQQQDSSLLLLMGFDLFALMQMDYGLVN